MNRPVSFGRARRLGAVLLPAVLLLGAAAASHAAIYRWVDAQGVVHYSDTPHPGASQVQLPALQTFSSPPPPPASPSQPSLATRSRPQRSCAIVQPASQQSLFAPEHVRIQVQVKPRLTVGQQLVVRLDGTVLASTEPGGTGFSVPDVYRGAHTITAVVQSPAGRSLCRAAPVTFYVRRPSILSPHSPVGHPRPHPPPVHSLR